MEEYHGKIAKQPRHASHHLLGPCGGGYSRHQPCLWPLPPVLGSPIGSNANRHQGDLVPTWSPETFQTQKSIVVAFFTDASEFAIKN